MHMADALLSPAVGGIMYAASVGGIAVATNKIKQDNLCEKRLPLMAVSGAFVFAAQMINFTIPGTGSSGHLGGGMLLSGMLGGAPALLAIACVLLIQCLFFADGGLLALGANIFNMGVIPCLIVYPLLFKRIFKKGITKGRLVAASVVASIVSMELGAFGVVLETCASGKTELPFTTFAKLMLSIHLAIGAVEGGITASVLYFVYRMRPEILESSFQGQGLSKGVSIKKIVIIIAVATVLVGGVLSLYASSNPDGLEWSIENVVGTTDLESEGDVHDTASDIQSQTAIMPDYDFSSEDGTGTSVAGIIGAILTCVLAGATGFVIKGVKRKKEESGKLKS